MGCLSEIIVGWKIRDASLILAALLHGLRLLRLLLEAALLSAPWTASTATGFPVSSPNAWNKDSGAIPKLFAVKKNFLQPQFLPFLRTRTHTDIRFTNIILPPPSFPKNI